MSLYQIFSSLLLTFFIIISYVEANTPTEHPTAAPTKCVCQSWTGNSDYIIDSGKGCKTSFDGYKICSDCYNTKCECVSAKDNKLCELDAQVDQVISTATTAFATWIIILIVIGSVCGLCFIGCIIYCVFAGALCCAASSKKNNNTTVN